MMSEDFDRPHSATILRNRPYGLVSTFQVRVQPHYGLLTMLSNKEYPTERLCRFLLQR